MTTATAAAGQASRARLAELEGSYGGFEWFVDETTGAGYVRIPLGAKRADRDHAFALLQGQGWRMTDLDDFFRSMSPINVVYRRLERI